MKTTVLLVTQWLAILIMVFVLLKDQERISDLYRHMNSLSDAVITLQKLALGEQP